MPIFKQKWKSYNIPAYPQFFYTGTHKDIHIITITHKHKSVNAWCILTSQTAARHMQQWMHIPISTGTGACKTHFHEQLNTAIHKGRKKIKRSSFRSFLTQLNTQGGASLKIVNTFQGIIQAVFEISNQFWVHQNLHPNFDELAKNKNMKPHCGAIMPRNPHLHFTTFEHSILDQKWTLVKLVG